MKKKIKITLFLVVLSFSGLAHADESEELNTAFNKWQRSISSGDSMNVVKLYKDDAMLLATLASEPITDQKGREKYFSNLVSKPDMKVEVNIGNIRLLDKNNAVLSGLYTFSFEQDGKLIKIPARYTFVYSKENGKWIIVEHHSSKVPQQN